MSTSRKIHNFFFHMVGKKWRCWAIMYALMHYFLPCKENLCWKPHSFYCSIIEASFSYKVYAWTDFRKITKKSCHIIAKIGVFKLVVYIQVVGINEGDSMWWSSYLRYSNSLKLWNSTQLIAIPYSNAEFSKLSKTLLYSQNFGSDCPRWK